MYACPNNGKDIGGDVSRGAHCRKQLGQASSSSASWHRPRISRMAIVGMLLVPVFYLLCMASLKIGELGDMTWGDFAGPVIILGTPPMVIMALILCIVAHARIRKSAGELRGKVLARLGVGVNVAIICLIILLPLIARRRESTHCCVCANNLKQLGLAFALYANENDNLYPPVGDTKNNFIFNADIIYPDYLMDAGILICRHAEDHELQKAFQLRSTNDHPDSHVGDVHPDCIIDKSYIYLGWDIRTDEEAGAFFEAYDRLSPEDYGKDILDPENGSVRFARLNSSHYYTASQQEALGLTYDPGEDPSLVPVMWDRPYTDPLELNHLSQNRWGPGGFVLYLDGHCRYVEFGNFPMTETMARLLEERPRTLIPDCE